MAPPRHLPAPIGVRVLLARALRLRCPRCGKGGLFVRRFAMHERCPVCDLRFEREQGYFIGAIYVNYALTVVACAAAVFAIDEVAGASVRLELAIVLPLAVLVPLVLFRYAKSLWLGIDYLVSTADEAAERRRRRR
jgi:uncharacterized protein (DUF983 family)